MRRVFALRRQQIRHDHVGRHAAAEVLRLLPVVAEAAVQAHPAAAVAVLDVAVVGPPVVVPQLIAVEIARNGTMPAAGTRRRDVAVAAARQRVADALHARRAPPL